MRKARQAAGTGAGKGTPDLAPRGVPRPEVSAFLDRLLDAGRFEDYCPNGLQVEGRPVIRRVLTAVTASVAALRRAAETGADALIVHHGWFWRGDDPCVTGTRRERLALALRHEINLYAYHLPLDAHPEVGNNARLARVLGWEIGGRFGARDLGCWADLERALDARSLAARVARRLGRRPLAVGTPPASIARVAWCTGAAQDMIEAAVEAGAQAFVSGEISERTTHVAREAGVLYLAAGHHATERYGVQALGERLAAQYGLAHEFFDDANPV